MIYDLFKNDAIDIDKYESKLSKIDFGFLINYCGVYFRIKKNCEKSVGMYRKSADLGNFYA